MSHSTNPREYAFKGRDILGINFTPDEINYIIDLAELFMKKDYDGLQKHLSLEYKNRSLDKLLRGHALGTTFYENSTRTRLSTEMAMHWLGGYHNGFSGTEGTSVMKNESLSDTLEMLDAYGFNVISLRHPLDGAARWVADRLDIPIINGGDGKHEHPTQTLLDLASMRITQGKLDDLNVGICGDLKYGRTTHSLAKALALFSGIKLYLIAPDIFRIPESYIEYLKDRNVTYIETEDLEEVVPELDILYQTRAQIERFEDLDPVKATQIAQRFQITAAKLSKAKDNMRLLHPLPIDKTMTEITECAKKTKYYFAGACLFGVLPAFFKSRYAGRGWKP